MSHHLSMDCHLAQPSKRLHLAPTPTSSRSTLSTSKNHHQASAAPSPLDHNLLTLEMMALSSNSPLPLRVNLCTTIHVGGTQPCSISSRPDFFNIPSEHIGVIYWLLDSRKL